jgi:predicted porin
LRKLVVVLALLWAVPTRAQSPTSPPAPTACTSATEFFKTDCPLTWHGITLYGAYDVGVGWVSHGMPENGWNYEGEALVNRNGNHSQFLIAPNNLQQTGFGIRGREEFAHDWFAVFNASTGINPQSGLFASAPATMAANAGLPRGSYSATIDGSRGGQIFNDEFYGGISSTHFGTLTFGRQRSLGTDVMLQYDPAGGGYGFSYIGYNGTMAGGGNTEDARWDDAVKYKFVYGPVHAGAMFKFVDGSGGCFSDSTAWTAANCTPQQPHNTAYGFDLGGTLGGFSLDAVWQHYNQAISVLNPLLGPQSAAAPFQSTLNSINTNPVSGGTNVIDPNNTVYGIVTDNTAIMVAAKYAVSQFKFFGGAEYIWQTNPSNPLGVGASAEGGYLLSGVEDNNLDSPKIVWVWWTGAKYTYERTDFTLSYYNQIQNDFRRPSTCDAAAGFRASCAGSLNEVSFYVDHHLTKRVDVYTGITYSDVSGGLSIAIPHGPGVRYFYNDNVAPVLGARFAF